MRPPLVILAHPGHPAVHRLAAVHELDRSLAEEEIHMIVVLQRADKVGRVEVHVVVLLSAQLVLDDQAVGGGEVCDGGGVEGSPGVEVGGVVVGMEGGVPSSAELSDQAVSATWLPFVVPAINLLISGAISIAFYRGMFLVISKSIDVKNTSFDFIYDRYTTLHSNT